jgi:hypothetical protein
MSGSVDSLLEAYHNAASKCGQTCTVKELADVLAGEIQAIRRRDVEQQYLQPYNLTLDNFVGRQREWTADFFERLNSSISDEDNDLGEVIVAGFDETAHIYSVEAAGWVRPWDATGFCTIGIGAQHAEAEFAHASYSPKRDWISAMRVTFFAKKRAEEAPGVGISTDLWHITEGGYWYYWPQSKVVQALNLMYTATRYNEIIGIQGDAERLNDVLREEFSVATPRVATEEERKEAEAKAEEADTAAVTTPDSSGIQGVAEGSQPPNTQDF